MFPPSHGEHRHGHIRLGDAHEIVRVLSEVPPQRTSKHDKVAAMMESLGALIHPGFDYHIILFDSLDRKPAPRVIDRVTFGPTYAQIEPRPDEEIQDLLDLCGPVCEQTIPTALSRLRMPTTYIYSEDTDAIWYWEIFKPRLLEPYQWADCMACYWASSDDRLIIYNAFRPVGTAPYTDAQRDLLSLITRGVAPVMDSAMFDDLPVDPTGLDGNQRLLLLAVLQGMSEREIAQYAGVMTEQVELALRTLFNAFGVSSRGELMAHFIDQRILRWLETDRDFQVGRL